ncbi:ATPase [Hyphomicrobium methylovorum]|uniref:helicase HerA-like domain-containing protein n=1 Tax=Hyphomicrobium methylovorum TaxID=84 RepID=UPI0015E67BCF|nr:helicase HerA-like domain-containing protein [Hyphomicrobium methylovorum]MBA2126892.1 ATPase [Hyphomicrobium methylovorum]
MTGTPGVSGQDQPVADPRDYVEGGLILIGCSQSGRELAPECIELALANRHGLVTGATGTGKTVTLQVLAEGFSAAGVPVFAADIKGDLSGIAEKGSPLPKLVARAQEIGLTRYGNTSFPVAFWDVFGNDGHPVRATVQEMGPLLLSRLLELTEPQEGVLNIAFRWAADEREAGDDQMVIRDLKDLRSIIDEMGKRASSLRSKYGHIAPATVGVIQRRLLVLEEQGADRFFGEPALDIMDFLKTAPDGRGVVNILAADKLMNTPRLYATFLLWLLTELFERLPEVGDLEKPKLVFLFDEAHILFNDAPKSVLEQVERVTRLIRSKGVGVYYVTQSPNDVPDRVSAQLGNRIQHALRAFTPREQKAIRAAAQTFRPNPELDTERVIQELTVGEALVSLLHGKGEPSMVQRTLIRPPMSRVGPLTPEERKRIIEADADNRRKYAQTLDRESAFERLQSRNTTVGQLKERLSRFSNLIRGKG